MDYNEKVVKEYKGSAEEYVRNIINSIYDEEKSKIGLMKLFKDQYGTTVALISGGLNGRGEWDKYFKSLVEVARVLKTTFGDMWLIDLENDCLDDVWYAHFGIPFNADEYENQDRILDQYIIPIEYRNR